MRPKNSLQAFDRAPSLNNKMAISTGDRIFYSINGAFLGILLLIIVLPILNVVASSFSSGDAVVSGRVSIWPVDFSLEGYIAVFKEPFILTGYANTIFYTVTATSLNIFMTVIAAYPLSRRSMPGRNAIMMFFTLTMIFSGGLIPTFLLIRNLGLINNRLVMIIPLALIPFFMIICRTFFQTTIPDDLHEAGQLDGCSEIRFFTSVVLPLSKAIIAVLILYYAVLHWNSFFNAFLYLSRRELYPLQIVLREILIANRVDASTISDVDLITNLNLIETLKYALILVACVPIWLAYPFVQRYFVQGVMIGAVKG